MRPYTIKIGVGEVYELAVVGDYVRIKTATVAVTIESPENNEQAELEQGDDISITAFSRLRIWHSSTAEQTVIIYIGKGTRAGSSKIGGSVSVSGGSISVSNISGAFVNSAKTVTNVSAQLLAGNAARRFVMIQNQDPAGNIWVTLDGSAATSANGVKLAPGASLILDVYAPIGEIMAIGDIASNANIVTVEG